MHSAQSVQCTVHTTQKRLLAPTQCASLLHWLPSASTLLLLANHLLPDIWHSLGFSSEKQHIPTFRRCDMSAGVWFNLTDNMQKIILIHDNPTIVCFGAVRLTYLASNVIDNLATNSFPAIQHPVVVCYLFWHQKTGLSWLWWSKRWPKPYLCWGDLGLQWFDILL